MKYSKKVSIGNFLKKGEDIKDGDLLEIANEGKQVEGRFGIQDVFLCKTSDGEEGNVSFNQTSINNIIDVYGEDAVNWIGKKVKVWIFKDIKEGKPQMKLIVSHPEAKLTDSGFVLPEGLKVVSETPKNPDEDDINSELDSIPF